jgi:lipase chaperone protein
MRTRTKKILGGSAVAVVVLLAGLYLSSRGSGPEARPAASASPGASPRAERRPASATASSPDGLMGTGDEPAPAAPVLSGDPDKELEELATFMRNRFGAKLKEPYIQIKMLEDLMRFFQKRSPDHWQEELLAFLKKAFPEMYDELAAMLRNRVDYEKWVKDNTSYLRGLSDKERRSAMWDARNRLFGKETAERIWASELKNQAMSDTLAALDANTDANLTQKLSTYKQRIHEIHGDLTDAYMERHRQETMNRFLDLSTVQKELSAMTPQERSQSLRTIRKEMGLDEEALKRWDELDRSRDARWDAGAKYMAEREALAKQLSGPELEAKLQQLRARYFGSEAEIIGQEEASGFFRFERPRQWGRN